MASKEVHILDLRNSSMRCVCLHQIALLWIHFLVRYANDFLRTRRNIDDMSYLKI